MRGGGEVSSVCAICGGTQGVEGTLCTGRGKKVHPKSCAGLVASEAIKIDPWDATTIRYRCDDHAARVLSARGRNVKQGLGYFTQAEEGRYGRT